MLLLFPLTPLDTVIFHIKEITAYKLQSEKSLSRRESSKIIYGPYTIESYMGVGYYSPGGRRVSE